MRTRSATPLHLALILPVLALLGPAGCGGPLPAAGPRGAAPLATSRTDLGPVVTASTPARAALLTGSAGDPVTVRGAACDALHAIRALSVGGQAVPAAGPPGGCVPFEVAQPARLGLNLVHAEALSDAWQLGTLAQGFLLAPAWFSAGRGAPDARAAGAVLLQVGPALLDDGDRATPDDAATLAGRLLAALDLDAALGPARVASPDADGDGLIDTHRYACGLFSQTNRRTGFEARKTGPLTHGAITVDRLQPVDGGLALRITVAAPRLPLSVTGVLDGGCLGAAQLTLGGDAGATALVLEGQAALGLDAAGAPAVSFPAFAATLEGLSLGVDVGALASWTGLGSALGDALTAAVRGAVQRAITGAVQGLVAGRAAAVLARLGGTRAVALPPELGGAVLLVDAALDGLVFDAAGGRLSLGIQVRPESPRPEHLAGGAPGAMRLGGTPPDLAARLAAAPDARIALAVQDDLLNQVLQAAWLAGAFDREFSPALGPALTGTRIALFAGLPPVVMPRAGGAPGVDLGWGEVAFTLGVAGPGGQLEARGTFSAILPVDHLAIGPAGLDLAFGDAVEAFVEVDDLNWGPGPEAREAAAGVLQGALRSLLPELLARAVRPVPLPRLDLHALDPALPDLALGLASPTLERDGRYAMLTAGIIAGPGAP